MTIKLPPGAAVPQDNLQRRRDREYLNKVISSANTDIDSHTATLNNNVSPGTLPAFSSGTLGTPGNFKGITFSGITPGVANTQFSVTHNLNYVPSGYTVFRINGTGHIYDSGTAWTTTQIFLKSDGTNMSYTILIF